MTAMTAMTAMTDRDTDPRVLPGSLVTFRRKCGKANCRCQTGIAHESPALSVSIAGKTKIVTLTAEEVPAVAAAVQRYRSSVDALETEARVALDGLLGRVAARRARGRQR